MESLNFQLAEGQFGGAYSDIAKTSLPVTTMQQLERSEQLHETKLAAIKEAKEILQRNPDLERLLALFSRGLF